MTATHLLRPGAADPNLLRTYCGLQGAPVAGEADRYQTAIYTRFKAVAAPAGEVDCGRCKRGWLAASDRRSSGARA